MAELMLQVDWSTTPLGPVDQWPTSLRTMVGAVLRNRFPMILWWTRDLIVIYNDAYAPMLGNKHPQSMGSPAPTVWAEIWEVLDPQARRVLDGEGATWNENLLLLLHRRGFLEETYWTFSYSPAPDDSGGVGGILVTVQETTAQVYDDRQLRLLRDLAAHAAEAKSAVEACATAAQILSADDADLPFALLYLVDPGGKEAVLAGQCHLEESDHPARPARISLSRTGAPEGGWPLAEAMSSAGILVVDGLRDRVGRLPGGRFGAPPERAVIAPLTRPGQVRPYGFLIGGVSPRREFDDRYRGLYRLTADQVTTAIANAVAHDEERRRAESLAELDRAKTAFFSNVSHEFRTPLTLLLGPLTDALESPRKTLEGESLKAAHRNSLRLLKLVNTLLDFARIEAGRVEASFEPVDLASVTADLASVFRSAAEKAGLTLRIDTPPCGDVYVDREMWEKIVLNLVSNALKFTFQGEIAVRLRSRDGSAELEVADTGVGIPPAEVPRLFERFHRVKNARSRTHEGSGIGLALVKDLVRLHGGTIRVNSEEGKGTTFSVTIPKGREHLPPENVRSPKADRSMAVDAAAFVEEAHGWMGEEKPEVVPSGSFEVPTAGHAGRGERSSPQRILVVDDNADMRAYLGRLLSKQWTVETAADGVTALGRARGAPPDLILLDVMMPGMDGFALLRELRADSALRTIPLILLSARAGEETRVEGLNAGADDYLVKPFSAKELLAHISSNLKLSRLRKDSEAAIRRSEELLRTAFRAARMFAFEWDLERGRAKVSEGAGRILGASSDIEEAQGWANIHPDDVGRARATVDRAIAKGDPLSLQIRFRRFDTNEWIWLEIQAQVLREEEGPATKVVGVGVDVTGDVTIRTALEDLNASLEKKVEERTGRLTEVIRELETFAFTVAHDLRAPLRAMSQLAEILIQDHATALDASGQDLARRIGRAAQRMDHLTRDLLAYSRVTRTDVVFESFGIRGLVGEVTSDLGENMAQSKASVTIQVGGELVLGNRFLLKEALCNLVDNALKFTKPGLTPVVRISVRGQPDRVRISVEDEGLGIEPAHQTRLFRVFERLDPQGGHPGTGIGLAIARKAVERMGGAIGVESEPGKGSRFWIELPPG